MDPNTANQPLQQQPINPAPVPQVNPAPPITPSPTQPTQGQRKWVKVILLILVLLILGVAGYFGYKYYFGQQTYNAGVYKEPQVSNVTITPTGYMPNPNDTTDQSIDSDTVQIDKSMTNLNTDVNTVDQSVSDQQTNLQ